MSKRSYEDLEDSTQSTDSTVEEKSVKQKTGKNYVVHEPNNVYDKLKNNTDIKAGDTIEYITNNQMGWSKFNVVEDEDKEGPRGLKLEKDWSFNDYEYGGKGKRKAKKTAKKRTLKKRKGKIRQTNKRHYKK
jgi:plastocyanin